MHGNTVMLMAYSILPQLDRIVVTYIPRHILLGNWRESIMLHASLFLIVLVIMAGLSVWLWQRLKRQHLRAADLAEHFNDSENTLSDCGCAILSWSSKNPSGILTSRLNWPEILGLEFGDVKPTADAFLSRLGAASRAQLRSPLIDNKWQDNRIGTMVDILTSAGQTQRFYLMAQRRHKKTVKPLPSFCWKSPRSRNFVTRSKPICIIRQNLQSQSTWKAFCKASARIGRTCWKGSL